jgi:hypothetical protein
MTRMVLLYIEIEIYSREERMKNRIGVFSAVGLMTITLALHPWPCEGQIRPKLDCQKMVFEYINALENFDIRTLARLTGQQYSEELESQAKKELESPEAKEQLAPLLEMLRLFPKIGEIPDWVTEVVLEYEYIEGDDLIEMQGEFVFTDDNWIIQDLEPRGEESLDEEEKKNYATKLSPAPPKGQNTVDAGLNELVAKLISAIKQKSWDDAEETGVHPDSCGLHPSDSPEEREKALERLSQLPSIGAIPAPATRVQLILKGTIDSEESGVEIEFHWPDNKLGILYVSFK